MAEIIILGTTAAVPSAEGDYTHLAVETDDQLVLVDCGSSPMTRLAQMNLDWRKLDDIVATHFHADHIASLPNLIVGMWLSGREMPLRIHGLKSTLDKIQQMLDLFEWQEWPGLFPISFHPVPEKEESLVIDTDTLQVTTSPTAHSVPSIGLKFLSPQSGQAAVYSSDTGPCESIVRLAQNAAVLIHEATGNHPGHSSPKEAGEIAHKANAGQLYLIHFMPQQESEAGSMIDSVQLSYPGQVTLAVEGMRILF